MYKKERGTRFVLKIHFTTLKYLSYFNIILILVTLNIRDENALKTIHGGELLVENYFSRIRELGWLWSIKLINSGYMELIKGKKE